MFVRAFLAGPPLPGGACGRPSPAGRRMWPAVPCWAAHVRPLVPLHSFTCLRRRDATRARAPSIAGIPDHLPCRIDGKLRPAVHRVRQQRDLPGRDGIQTDGLEVFDGRSQADHAGDVSAYAAPARAKNLADLPAAYISTMEFDPLRDEGILYGLRLLQAGVSVELHSYPGTFHGSALVPTASVSKRGATETIHVLGRRLAARARDADTGD